MVNKCIRLFRGALVALGIGMVCLAVIPMIDSQTKIPYLLAAIFWMSMLAECVLLGCSNHVRRKIEEISPHMKQKRGSGKIGLLCFAQNREAAACDILLLVSILYLAVILLLKINGDWLITVGILAMFLLFHMHCILNGILYKSIKHYQIVIHRRRGRK